MNGDHIRTYLLIPGRPNLFIKLVNNIVQDASFAFYYTAGRPSALSSSACIYYQLTSHRAFEEIFEDYFDVQKRCASD